MQTTLIISLAMIVWTLVGVDAASGQAGEVGDSVAWGSFYAMLGYGEKEEPLLDSGVRQGFGLTAGFGTGTLWQVELNWSMIGFNDTILTLSPMRGVGRAERFYIISAFAGPSFGVLTSSGSKQERQTTVGVAGNAMAVLLPIKHLGIGVVVRGSIDTGDWSVGWGFALVVGGKRPLKTQEE